MLNLWPLPSNAVIHRENGQQVLTEAAFYLWGTSDAVLCVVQQRALSGMGVRGMETSLSFHNVCVPDSRVCTCVHL